MKCCSRCGKYKLLSDFWKRRSAKDGHRGICIICERASNKQYDDAHRDLRRASSRRWRDNNKEYRSEYDRNYKAIHKEQTSAQQARYYDEHREEILASAKIYNQEHKAEKSLYNADYYQKNKPRLTQYRKEYKDSSQGRLVYRVNENKRRALKYKAEGNHTVQDILDQGEKQGWVCYWRGPYCLGYCKDNFHEDHLIPLSRGGSDWPNNIVISCPVCNSQKHDRLPEEYKEYIKKLAELKRKNNGNR